MKTLIYVLLFMGMALSAQAQMAYADDSAFQINIAQNGDSSDKLSRLVLPHTVNLEKVKKQIVIAHAAECISLAGTYTIDIFVNKKGKYVSHLPTPLDNLGIIGNYLSDLEFNPARFENKNVSAWVPVTLYFGRDK